MKINPLEVIRSVRAALARVTGESVTLTRAEFEALAIAVEKPARRAKVDEAQTVLPLEPAPNPPEIRSSLPGNLSPGQLRALLSRPKTAATLAREVKLSPATVKRALQQMPDVRISRTRARAHTPGRRPNVYEVIH